MDMTVRSQVISRILRERARQDQMYGERNLYPPERWLVILSEEIGEVSKSVLESDPDNYVTELVQVAAVAVAALENFLLSRLENDL